MQVPCKEVNIGENMRVDVFQGLGPCTDYTTMVLCSVVVQSICV